MQCISVEVCDDQKKTKEVIGGVQQPASFTFELLERKILNAFTNKMNQHLANISLVKRS